MERKGVLRGEEERKEGLRWMERKGRGRTEGRGDNYATSYKFDRVRRLCLQHFREYYCRNLRKHIHKQKNKNIQTHTQTHTLDHSCRI